MGYCLPQTQKPWPTRREIAEQDLLAGNELIWLSDRVWSPNLGQSVDLLKVDLMFHIYAAVG